MRRGKRRNLVIEICSLVLLYIGNGERLNEIANDYDVQTYFRNYKNLIPHCDQSTQNSKFKKRTTGTCIYISPEGALIHARDLHDEAGSGKQMLMDMMIRGVLNEISNEKNGLFGGGGTDKSNSTFPRRNWISFLMIYTASGPVRDEQFPVLAFGKRDPDIQPGLLIPNPFFISPRWWDQIAASSVQESTLQPWYRRKNKLLFRGACGPGAHARFELLRIRDPHNLLDVGFNKVDGYQSIEECVVDLANKLNRTNDDINFILNHRIKSLVPQSNFSQYRYLMHMPGSATGSYSRNLQYLWSHGSIIFIWKHTASEWYYQHLRDGVHYVSVDQNTIYPLLLSLQVNPHLQLKMRRGSKVFARNYLSGRTLTNRWSAILSILAERQAQDIPKINKDIACTCDTELLSQNAIPKCQKCEITKKRGRAVAKFVGLIPKSS
uniref:Glycosyl transferase CAP10 domain-containing protein n=1 Tax=Aureoumbra lagunensis TaxID=44058 RepID=A0A7S3NK87_9STRA|mmetsp:Transcript_7502/g.11222  ORF Transcript_7502/g.11222 Transcript_7502/m.11222 type:complete len:436 (-) Transcript_7502:305-1612(-)